MKIFVAGGTGVIGRPLVAASHRHARSAIIYAYVLAGEIRSQVDDDLRASTRPVRRGSKTPALIIG